MAVNEWVEGAWGWLVLAGAGGEWVEMHEQVYLGRLLVSFVM